ncbi:hypothetical protein ColLi_13095 [Colletotrichum liriopes]|uniref:Uncharacterized protein n=1 Tax=Colletotrichum liriopes TaxID=708192 RepID=A0AA37H1L9_9PEZI|nr:hypothetical protein ColLi_13095 [Colletotrichum liriopes]
MSTSGGCDPLRINTESRERFIRRIQEKQQHKKEGQEENPAQGGSDHNKQHKIPDHATAPIAPIYAIIAVLKIIMIPKNSTILIYSQSPSYHLLRARIHKMSHL